MTDLADWIAEKRAACDKTIRELAGGYPPRYAMIRFNRAFPPETTRRLLDAVEALAGLVTQIEAPGYEMAAFASARVRAKAALDALGGGGE